MVARLMSIPTQAFLWALAFIAAPSFASPPDVEVWSKLAVEAYRNSESKTLPRRVIFADKIAEGTSSTLLVFDDKEFNNLSIIKAASSRDLNWSFKLNSFSLEETEETKKNSKFQNMARDLMRGAKADLLVYAPSEPGKNWEVMVLEGFRPIVVASLPPPNSRSSAHALHQWLFAALGYDGLILDVRDGYALVMTSRDLLTTPESQALVLADSHAKKAVPLDEQKGHGILTLVNSKGMFGIYRTTFVPSGAPDLYSKLVLERKIKKTAKNSH